MRTLTPPSTGPSTFSSGTSQSSKLSSTGLEPRMPNLSSFCAEEKPFMPRSMMKAVMPFECLSGDVLAKSVSGGPELGSTDRLRGSAQPATNNETHRR